MCTLKSFFLLALLSLTARAQLVPFTDQQALKDTIVAYFNRNDLRGIYALADSSFTAHVSESQLVSLLADARSLGAIQSSHLLPGSPDSQIYQLVFAKKSLQLTLTARSATQFSSFGLTYYQLPLDRTRSQFLTDNALRTHLDSIVQQAATLYMRNKHVAGLSIGIYRQRKTYTYNFGEVEKGKGQLPSATTLYEIGSITKTFTGLLLAIAVVQGKVSLRDDIRTYLAGAYPNLAYQTHPIRLVQLSNHTSGLPSQPTVPSTNDDPFATDKPFTKQALSALLHQVTPDTLPGSHRAYSNFGMGLLGLILAERYHTTYEQLVKKYILDPYQMTQTRITLPPRERHRLAQGYDLEGTPTPYWRNALAEPAGGLRSTTQDMLLYIQHQLDPLNKAAGLTHQLTFGTPQQGMGLGWGIATTKQGNHLRWSHDGGTDGFTSLCLIYPELNSGIVLLTNNGNHTDKSFYDIAHSIYASWLP